MREGENCQPGLRDQQGEQWGCLKLGRKQGGSGKREEGRGKGQGEVRSENSAKGLGGEKAPLHLCRGTAGTRPAEQKSELRNQKDGEKTR